jgi:chromosomal replication initiator protein
LLRDIRVSAESAAVADAARWVGATVGSISAWGDISARLRKRIGRAAYEEWFRNLLVREEGHALVIECPDPFTLHWIRGHYGAAFEEAAASDFIEIRYELPQTGPNARTAAAPALAVAAAAPPAPTSLAAVRRLPPSAALAAATPPTRGLAAPAPGPRVELAQAPFSFESFVIGPHNALAAEAARALARGQVEGLSPLVLTGVHGDGKSHLCRSIERAVPGAIYCSAEEFTSEVTAALRSGQLERVRQRYRKSANLLIIEDVQFLPGKRATQVELFHTLDHLMQRGKSVVLTADRPPSEIPGLDEQLASRMSGGLIARIGAPDSSTCRRILAEKAARGGVRLPESCLAALAERPVRSVRELIGALNQFVARATLLKRPLDVSLLNDTLGTSTPALPRRSMQEIIELTARAYTLSTEDLRSPSRRRAVVRARQFAMYLCRCYTDASLKDIGRVFDRDHTSVLHAVRVVEQRNLEQVQHRYEFEALAGRLGLPKARP